ncbi:MAG: chromate transporter [Telluria sp.]
MRAEPTIPKPNTARPTSLADLFFSFTILALQGFGGVLAVIQRELVDRKRWLTNEEFIEEWAVAQVMPGPNAVNLSMMIGARYFGLAGAMAALAGMLALPLMLVLLLAVVHAQYASHPAVSGALRGMAAVSAGLIAATALRMAAALVRNPVPLPWCVALASATFVLLALVRAPLVAVLLPLGGLGVLLAWRGLRP